VRYFLLFALLGLLLAVTPTDAHAAVPADTLFLHDVNPGPWARYFSYCLDPHNQSGSGARAAELWAAGRFRLVPPGRVLQAGFTQDRLWLRATVVNTLPQRTRFVWSVYEFVDSAALFVQPDGRGQPRYEAGANGRLIAQKRIFPARATCLPFWLDAHARAVVYLRLENHTGALYVPTDLTTTEDFLLFEETYITDEHWAWLLGLYLGSVLFNLILYAFLRDRIYVWYGAYVFFTTWFLLMEDGLDALLLPQAIYGLGWQTGQYSMLLLALGCGLRIMALFVRLRQSSRPLNRLSWALSGVAAGYALVYSLLFGPALRAGGAGLALLNGGREVLLWGLVLAGAALLLTVWRHGRAPQRRLAGYYGLTYLFFALGTIQFLLNRSGVVNIHFINPNSLAWGLALELLTLSILLTGRFRFTLRQNADLRVQQLREREAAGQRLIAAQDEEREALARELHDALAPSLTALHLAWQGRQVRQALAQASPVLTEAHEQTEALLRQLRHDVRTLSHALMPGPASEQPPLPEAVGLLAETLNLDDSGPHIVYHCDPDIIGVASTVQLAAYRIVAELLHNALRHAKATEVKVEMRLLPTCLRLSIADNGQGFDPSGPLPRRGGLGLRGVQARAGYMRGQVLVSSQPGQGTLITVDLPTH
jgi:signal transduction histidine kinase